MLFEIDGDCQKKNNRQILSYYLAGRSNAINIAERLGLQRIIIDSARELYGTESTEINEVTTSIFCHWLHVLASLFCGELYISSSKRKFKE